MSYQTLTFPTHRKHRNIFDQSYLVTNYWPILRGKWSCISFCCQTGWNFSLKCPTHFVILIFALSTAADPARTKTTDTGDLKRKPVRRRGIQEGQQFAAWKEQHTMFDLNVSRRQGPLTKLLDPRPTSSGRTQRPEVSSFSPGNTVLFSKKNTRPFGENNTFGAPTDLKARQVVSVLKTLLSLQTNWTHVFFFILYIYLHFILCPLPVQKACQKENLCKAHGTFDDQNKIVDIACMFDFRNTCADGKWSISKTLILKIDGKFSHLWLFW